MRERTSMVAQAAAAAAAAAQRTMTPRSATQPPVGTSLGREQEQQVQVSVDIPRDTTDRSLRVELPSEAFGRDTASRPAARTPTAKPAAVETPTEAPTPSSVAQTPKSTAAATPTGSAVPPPSYQGGERPQQMQARQGLPQRGPSVTAASQHPLSVSMRTSPTPDDSTTPVHAPVRGQSPTAALSGVTNYGRARGVPAQPLLQGMSTQERISRLDYDRERAQQQVTQGQGTLGRAQPTLAGRAQGQATLGTPVHVPQQQGAAAQPWRQTAAQQQRQVSAAGPRAQSPSGARQSAYGQQVGGYPPRQQTQPPVPSVAFAHYMRR